MKKVLIMVISSQEPPYGEMINTSLNTWDKVEVEGVETLFYCGKPLQQNTDKVIYFPVKESLHSMGKKDLIAYEWALQNKEFDFVARVNSSCYVNKKKLFDYCQTLPVEKIFAGLPVTDTPKWIWGGGQFIISRDVLQRMVDMKDKWNHNEMEDKAMSYLVNEMGIEYTPSPASSISIRPDGKYDLLCYNADAGFTFSNFAELNKLEIQYFFRIKQDGQRQLEKNIMTEMYLNLKQ